MSKKILSSLLLLIIVSSLTSSLQLVEGQIEPGWEVEQVVNINPMNIDNENDLKREPLPKLINHEPILIYTEQNFTDYGFPGNGTETNPYRIENLEIETSQEIAIAVYDISQQFIIKDCQVRASLYGIYIENCNSSHADYFKTNTTASVTDNICSSSRDGIHISNSWSAKVANNTCLSNTGSGIRTEDSGEVIVRDNNCGLNDYGISLYKSHLSDIENNFCFNNTRVGLLLRETETTVRNNTCILNDRGIELISAFSTITESNCSFNTVAGINLLVSSSSKIINNFCSNNKYGIHSKDSFYITLENNTCTENEYGISLIVGSWHCKILGNHCYNNALEGIVLISSRYILITNNTVLNNKGYGIHLEQSINLTLSYNLVQNNSGYGVYLDRRTNDTIIIYNFLIDNNISGTSQGYDSGKDNKWFDEENKAGNYWSDWKGRGKYSIDGSAESFDKYPLNENLVREAIFPIFWIILTICIASLVRIFSRTEKRFKR
jgi:parallel beta-helix repeat protein